MAELIQWEYKQVDFKDNTPEYMNKLGEQGWELVTTRDGFGISKLVYKRPKQQQRTQPTNYGYGY